MAIANFIDRIRIGDSTDEIAIGSSAYGECNTDAITPAKTVNIPGFTLNKGTTIYVKFINRNTASSPTLNVSGTGAKPIVQYGTSAVGTENETSGWQPGAVVALTYDGTSWVKTQGYNTNTNNAVTQTGNTENKEFSILLKNTNNTTDETAGVKYGKTSNKLVTVNPSTGGISAAVGTFSGNVSIGGNVIFPNANILDWNGATYRQRITITDDSTADTAVFTFQQSSNTGTSYSNLFTIKDNGTVIATLFSGSGAALTNLTPTNLTGVVSTTAHKFLKDTGAWTQIDGSDLTGTVAVDHGGTGKTTANDAANALIGSLPTWTANPTDNVYLIRRDTAGSATFGQVKFSTVWNYIKGKADSAYSTSEHTHGNITNDGKMSGSTASGTVTTSHKFLREDGTWTVPAYTTNTDSKVSQTASTTSKWRKLLLGHAQYEAYNTSISGETDVAYEAVGISAQPSTGSLRIAGSLTTGSTITGTAFYGSGANITLDTASVAVITDANKKLTTQDLTVSDASANDDATTTFVQAVTQSATGKITVTKAALDTSGNWNGLAATATADASGNTITTTYATKTEMNGLLAAADAMIFKGTIGAGGTINTTANPAQTLPTAPNIGWTYKVITSGEYDGKQCEAGDLLICVNETSGSIEWIVVQTNIDGAVTGPSSAIDTAIATFDGTTGKIIKNSGLKLKVLTNTAFGTTGWNQLGCIGTSTSILTIAKPSDTKDWGTAAHSAMLAYGTGDTKGMIDIAYNNPLISFAGGNNGGSTNEAPKWYFKISATSGATYTLPSSSKTLAATDGSNASGKWSISTSGKADTAGTADKLGTSDVGSSRQAIYLDDGTPTAGNYTIAHLGNAGKSNMNDIGKLWPSTGMTNLTSTSNADTPRNGTTYTSGWHLYWDTSYTDNPSNSNSWVAQIVNKAGTNNWWVRSRSGSTITNGTAWASSWRHLVTSTEATVGGNATPIYINENGEATACTDCIAIEIIRL